MTSFCLVKDAYIAFTFALYCSSSFIVYAQRSLSTAFLEISGGGRVLKSMSLFSFNNNNRNLGDKSSNGAFWQEFQPSGNPLTQYASFDTKPDVPQYSKRSNTTSSSNQSQRNNRKSPFPPMPSQTFRDLVHSQFELLSNALLHSTPSYIPSYSSYEYEPRSKIKSIVLYLPQENSNTGQLEFLPSLVYPSLPKSERIFIASDSKSGLAPTIPPTLTQLPGFTHAANLIPTYPFTAVAKDAGGASAAVGTLEEVLCDRKLGGSAALSLPLFSGAQTIGAVLIWGQQTQCDIDEGIQYQNSIWTDEDKAQIRRMGETVAMALCLDSDRYQNQIKTEDFQVAIADNLHQVKNPVQALRTFTKLLQRNLATDGDGKDIQLERLIENMVVQSDRIIQNLSSIDSVLDAIEDGRSSSSSYQRLLSPMERRSLALQETPRKQSKSINPKLMSTSSYLVKLSTPVENDATYPQTQSKSRNRVPVVGGDSNEDQLQIGFLPDNLQSVLSAYKVIAEENGIQFEVYGMEDNAELPGVTLRPNMLQEAVTNVLDNAIKYVTLGCYGNWNVKNPSPKIRVRIKSNSNDDPSGVMILVDDNGPGISLSDREAVFERGFRGQDAREVSPGTGIGLEICKAIITEMGGDLSVLDECSIESLGGTTIRFILYRKPIEYNKRNF